MSRKYDTIVIGGGPSGSCAAAVLAQRGRRVLVLERARFPRLCVGESLIPEVHAPLRRIGALQRIENVGFIVKHGATFSFETGTPSNSIRFANRFGRGETLTFQVERAIFDDELLGFARDCGAEVEQEARAREVELSDRGVRVQIQNRAGDLRWEEGEYLIDASGQGAFLNKRLGFRQPDARLRNIAVFAHFEDWRWPESIPAGDAHLISRRDMGWVWLIPLRGRMSVGLVMPTEVETPPPAAERIAWFEARLAEMPILDEQIAPARRVTDLHTLAEFSYSTSAYHGERWLVTGDASSFIDPVFSTGVYLGLAGAEDAANAVDAALTSPAVRQSAFRRFAREQRRRYRFFHRYVGSFYRPAVRDLLCQPAHELGLPRAWTTVLAGETRLRWDVKLRMDLFYLLAAMHERVPFLKVTGRYHGVRAPDPVPERRRRVLAAAAGPLAID